MTMREEMDAHVARFLDGIVPDHQFHRAAHGVVGIMHDYAPSATARAARIERAAKAAYEWDADKSNSPTWDEYDEGAKGWYREIVTIALDAADELARRA